MSKEFAEQNINEISIEAETETENRIKGVGKLGWFIPQDMNRNIYTTWRRARWDLKHDQRHQTRYALLDPEKGYNNATLDRPRLNNTRQKANVKVFANSENTSIMSLEDIQK